MKIISQPDLTAWKHIVNCYVCSAKLEVSSADLKFRIEKRWYPDERHGGGSYFPRDYYFVECPLCNKEVDIQTALPFLLQEEVKKRSNKK